MIKRYRKPQLEDDFPETMQLQPAHFVFFPKAGERRKLAKGGRRLARYAHRENIDVLLGIETAGYKTAALLQACFGRMYPNEKVPV
ncbi:MAG: hypothetical protein GF334_10055, partial [Candidatus Altiarchaeales archaeon]|nr:hypothetical protein [Candidatus Altiarchaeales archaeon]